MRTEIGSAKHGRTMQPDHAPGPKFKTAADYATALHTPGNVIETRGGQRYIVGPHGEWLTEDRVGRTRLSKAEKKAAKRARMAARRGQ
jgi:hypothetical protein